MFHSNFNVTLRLDGRWRHRCFSHSVFHVWLILLNNKNKNGVIHRFRIPNGRIHPTTVQSGGASLTFDPPVQKMSCNFCCYCCCCCCCCCWRGFCGKLGRFQGQKNVWMWPGNLAACDTCKVAPFCQLIPPGAPQEINEWIPHFLVCGGRWGGGGRRGNFGSVLDRKVRLWFDFVSLGALHVCCGNKATEMCPQIARKLKMIIGHVFVSS